MNMLSRGRPRKNQPEIVESTVISTKNRKKLEKMRVPEPPEESRSTPDQQQQETKDQPEESPKSPDPGQFEYIPQHFIAGRSFGSGIVEAEICNLLMQMRMELMAIREILERIEGED